MVVIVLSVLTVNLLLHRPLVESLLFSVALAVGLSPELLPAIVSVTLAAGARAMSKQGVIVRRLDAIEKPGQHDRPLHRQDRHADRRDDCSRRRHRSGDARQPRPATRVSQRLFETGIDNPIDAAIVSAGEQAGLSTAGHGRLTRSPTTSSGSA
jgi:Mg2+-importing ATPase